MIFQSWCGSVHNFVYVEFGHATESLQPTNFTERGETMLAQNFMMAEQLGIEQDVRDGLVDLLGRMERGEIEHVSYRTQGRQSGTYDLTYSKFHMAHWGLDSDCGTVRCMGGYLECIIGRPLWYVREKLHALFYPDVQTSNNWDNLTVDVCAHTLRGYLTAGKIDWSHVGKR